MKPSVVVTNYGTGINSVLLVNQAIRDGIQRAGILAHDGDLTWRGDNPDDRFRYAGEVRDAFWSWLCSHGAPDVLIGQASFALPLFRLAREYCPKTLIVLQRDSTHVRTWKDLVDAEYQRLGLEKRFGEDLTRHDEAEYDLADKITVLARWVERSFVDRGLADKVVYASPQTIDLRRWPFHPPRNDDIGFRVMAAGQLRIAKGTHILLEAWRKLDPGPNDELILSGVISEPDEADFIKREIAATPQATVIGWTPIEQMSPRFQACDVYCLPSLQEGSSMTCVEALASGRPIVVSDRCGSDLLDQHPGAIGEIVPFDDPVARVDLLAEVLDAYRSNPARRARHGQRAREVVEECGGMERFGRDYAATIERLWADHR